LFEAAHNFLRSRCPERPGSRLARASAGETTWGLDDSLLFDGLRAAFLSWKDGTRLAPANWRMRSGGDRDGGRAEIARRTTASAAPVQFCF